MTNTLSKAGRICFDTANEGRKKDLTNTKKRVKDGMVKILTASPANTRPASFQSEGACFCEPSPLTLSNSITYHWRTPFGGAITAGEAVYSKTNRDIETNTIRGTETNAETNTKDREQVQ